MLASRSMRKRDSGEGAAGGMMNRSFESVLRFVNLTTSGLLAGSLGFGESALTPGWEQERSRHSSGTPRRDPFGQYFNAIGPVALVSALALVVGTSGRGRKAKFLDAVAAVGQAGVLASTTLLTVPLNKKLELVAPVDYPSVDSQHLTKSWARAHAVRTALGITAFVCAVASMSARK
jgi:hypothetical protein